MPTMPPEVLAAAEACGTPLDVAQTIYDAYLERTLPQVVPEPEEVPA